MAEEALTWIDSDGGAWSLADPDRYYVPSPGMVGMYGVESDIVSYVVPGMPGDREQWVQIKPNDIRVPLLVLGSDGTSVEQRRRAIAQAMRATRGVGTLRHLAHDGVTRDLLCREVSGFRDVTTRGPSSLLVGLSFRAADPYWYDTDETVIELSPTGLVSFFQATFFSVHLSASGLSSAFHVHNDGEAEAWPIWVIHGPGTSPTLTNTTTGAELALTGYSLTGTQILTIDTNPGIATVTREDGSSQWANVDSDSALWSLARGGNDVALAMTSTTSASSLQLRYRRRWEGV